MSAKTKPETKQPRPLTPKQELFVREYLVDLNATQAAIRAGYSVKTAEQLGFQLLQKPSVRAKIEEAKAKRVEKVEVTAEFVLRRLLDIATADPNELIQHQRVNCRHCYGIGHEYQWIDHAEWLKVCQSVEEATPEDQETRYPNANGGFGFDQSLSPHAKCPKCHGYGHGRVHALDTRKLSRSAKALYAGVKATKDGLEIKMHDQFAALTLLAKHVGVASDKIKLGTEEGDPIQDLLKVFMGTRITPVEKPGREVPEHEIKNTTATEWLGSTTGADVDRGGVERSSSSAITPRRSDEDENG